MCSVWLLLLHSLSMSVSPTSPHWKALLCRESGLSWALAHEAGGVAVIRGLWCGRPLPGHLCGMGAWLLDGRSWASGGQLPTPQGHRAEEHRLAHAVGEEYSQELGSGAPTWPPRGCRPGANLAGWTGPGAGLGDPVSGLQDPGPAVSAQQALECVDSAVLWNSGQTVHSCPRGNGFSLNLQFFLLNRQPVFQGLFSVLRNCTRRAPSRALTSGSSLKLLLCSYPGPCPLHPAWPHGGPI